MTTTIQSIIRFPMLLAIRTAFVVLGLPLLFVIEPFRHIRLGLLYTRRIGHLAGNTDLFLRELQINGTDPKTVYIFAGIEPANRQLFEMIKRHLPVYESRWLTRILFYLRPILQRTRFWQALPWNTPRYDVFNGGRATLTFTSEELENGRAQLANMGIGEGDWYVCLHARDPAYLDAHLPDEASLWRTRDFRNCSIENYLKAAEYITSLGGYVIRMGALVDRPLPETGNPRIIDYAAHHRSDFMDIYLPAHCRFFLGSDSGLFLIASIFDVPVALGNGILFRYSPFRRDDLFIVKLIRPLGGGAFLDFDGAIGKGFYQQGPLPSANQEYEMVENSAEDILGMAQEMMAKLENRELDPIAQQASAQCHERFLSGVPGYLDAGSLSPAFALKYRHLITPGEMPAGMRASG